jgi:hypothetical protein
VIRPESLVIRLPQLSETVQTYDSNFSRSRARGERVGLLADDLSLVTIPSGFEINNVGRMPKQKWKAAMDSQIDDQQSISYRCGSPKSKTPPLSTGDPCNYESALSHIWAESREVSASDWAGRNQIGDAVSPRDSGAS